MIRTLILALLLSLSGAPLMAIAADKPPTPRERPKREFAPLSQAERDKNFKRAIKKYRESPEFRDRVHEMYERLRRLDEQKQQLPEKGA